MVRVLCCDWLVYVTWCEYCVLIGCSRREGRSRKLGRAGPDGGGSQKITKNTASFMRLVIGNTTS